NNDGTLLAWLTERRVEPTSASLGPWAEPFADSLDAQLQRVVDHAELFSLVMHGAALLYNVLVARRCDQLGLPEGPRGLPGFEEQLDVWSDAIDSASLRVDGWDVADLWRLVHAQNPRVSGLTTDFVEAWLTIARTRRRRPLRNDSYAIELVEA